MERLWSYFSNLGVTEKNNTLQKRSDLLFNQMNIFTTLIWLFIFLFLETERLFFNNGGIINSLGSFLPLIVGFGTFYLAKIGHKECAKALYLVAPSFLFLIAPCFFGLAEEENLTYYPYVIVAFSLVPQLVLVPNKDKWLYYGAIIYFSLLLLLYDVILLYWITPQLQTSLLIKGFFANYKLSQVIIYIFANYSVYYLRKINMQFEEQLSITNDQLKESNQLLDERNEALTEINDRLIITQEQLIQSEKMASLGTLTAGVAHEINNPLNFINGGLMLIDEVIENMQTMPGNESRVLELIHASKVIDKGVVVAAGIVSSMMDFSHKGSTKLVVRNIHKVIDSSLLFLKSKMDHIQLERHFEIQEEYLMNPEKMHQILMNIFDNAAYELNKQAPSIKKVITIKTHTEKVSPQDEYAIISIFNNGPLIPNEIINKIFDPFYSSKQIGEGIGLGLYITYQLITDCSGTVAVLNHPKGVEFILRFPLITKMESSGES